MQFNYGNHITFRSIDIIHTFNTCCKFVSIQNTNLNYMKTTDKAGSNASNAKKTGTKNTQKRGEDGKFQKDTSKSK